MILRAKAQLDSGPASEIDTRTNRPVDYQEAAWTHYNQTLHNDKVKRDTMPTPVEIDLEYERTMQRIDAGEIDVGRDPYDRIDLSALNLTFVGGPAFSGTLGELRYIPGFVVGDLNGDGVNDFAIELSGAPALTAGDFIL